MPSAAWRRSTGGRCEPTIGHVGPVRLRLSRVFCSSVRSSRVAAVHLTTGLRLRLLMLLGLLLRMLLVRSSTRARGDAPS